MTSCPFNRFTMHFCVFKDHHHHSLDVFYSSHSTSLPMMPNPLPSPSTTPPPHSTHPYPSPEQPHADTTQTVHFECLRWLETELTDTEGFSYTPTRSKSKLQFHSKIFCSVLSIYQYILSFNLPPFPPRSR